MAATVSAQSGPASVHVSALVTLSAGRTVSAIPSCAALVCLLRNLTEKLCQKYRIGKVIPLNLTLIMPHKSTFFLGVWEPTSRRLIGWVQGDLGQNIEFGYIDILSLKPIWQPTKTLKQSVRSLMLLIGSEQLR